MAKTSMNSNSNAEVGRSGSSPRASRLAPRESAASRLAPAAKQFGKVAVLLGGKSAEREVSLMSGGAVLEALKCGGVDAHAFDPKLRGFDQLIKERFDRAFIALHGRYGEDGTMQGALEQIGLRYTGSGVMASALAMDKWRTKLIWQQAGVPTPPSLLVNAASDVDALVKQLGLPLIVKPVHEGSTIGLTKVTRADQIRAAVAAALKHDSFVLAEKFIEGKELTASILGEQALPLIHIEPAGEMYDYHAKYVSDETQYHCPSGLPAAQEAEIQRIALQAFKIVGCRGWGRVDVMLDAQGKPWLLEVNTSPGMTSHSLVPMAAKAAGISFDQLVLRILELIDAGS
jgi:D-alanine-D-alanine ligase